jgi:hypothetical protein
MKANVADMICCVRVGILKLALKRPRTKEQQTRKETLGSNKL